MKNRFPCELIRDLLPSYIEELTSETTNVIVEEHIAECGECRSMLEAMREPSIRPVESDEKKEIDFLKKNRKKNQRIIAGSVLLAMLAAAAVLLVKWLFVGSYVNGDSVAYELQVEGNHLTISGTAIDDSLGISSVEYCEQEGGVITVTYKAVRSSPFHKGRFQSEYTAEDEITQICVDDRIVWANGERISAVVSDVFHSRHPYIGDMPSNGRTAGALHIADYLGGGKSQLQTSAEPYGWKIILEDEITASQQEIKEKYMKSCAYVLLAVIDNLGEVSYEYRMDGKVYTVVVTEEEAAAFAGQDIKNCGQEVLLLQRLMEKAGLMW